MTIAEHISHVMSQYDEPLRHADILNYAAQSIHAADGEPSQHSLITTFKRMVKRGDIKQAFFAHYELSE